jgi:Tetratricopeptide repeat
VLAKAGPGPTFAAGRERRSDADLTGLLDARRHLLDVGDTKAASGLTEVICARLRAQGDMARAAALGQATLEAMPSPSASAARWLHELGTLAQLSGDHAAAADQYLRAVHMFAEVGDAAGVARSYDSLGALAHARGDYQEAERYYQAATCFHPPPVAWPARDGAADRPLPPEAQSGEPQPGEPDVAALALTDIAPATPRPAVPTLSEAACAEAARASAARAGAAAAGTGAAGAGAAGAGAAGAGATDADAAEAGEAEAGEAGRAAADPAGTEKASGAGGASGAGQGRARSLAGARPPDGRRHARRAGPRRRGRPRGLRPVAVATLAIAATVVIVRTVGPAGTASARADLAGAGAAGGAAGAAAAGGDRVQAAAWVARWLDGGAVVGCDAATCTALSGQGVAAGDLLVIGADGQADPLGCDIVVATATVRAVLGARLAQVYAPLVLARFGHGSARIEVRAVAPDGTAAYLRALRADQAARAQAGQQLLANRRLTEAPAARRALGNGQVDTRLLTTIAALTPDWRLRILGFGAAGPGGDPRVPRPSAEIAAAGPGPAARELSAVAAFLRAQRSPYLAVSVTLARLPSGQVVLRVAFGEPAPLGLLAPDPVSPASIPSAATSARRHASTTGAGSALAGSAPGRTVPGGPGASSSAAGRTGTGSTGTSSTGTGPAPFSTALPASPG